MNIYPCLSATFVHFSDHVFVRYHISCFPDIIPSPHYLRFFTIYNIPEIRFHPEEVYSVFPISLVFFEELFDVKDFSVL